MIRLPRQYKRKIAAGESEIIEKAGQYFYIPEADQLAFVVEIDDKAQMLASAGRGWQADLDDEDFSKLRIVNTGGAELNLTIEIGFGRPLDQRLSVSGVVNIQGVTGGVAVAVENAANDKAYTLFGTRAADGANASRVQLSNPAASGVLLRVHQVRVLPPASTGNARLIAGGVEATLVSTGFIVDNRGVAGVGEIRSGIGAVTAAPEAHVFSDGAGEIYRPTAPHILQENSVLTVETAAINTALMAGFFWDEVPV